MRRGFFGFGGVKVGQLRLREISVGSVKGKESLKVITIGPSRQWGGGEFNSKAQNCFCLPTRNPHAMVIMRWAWVLLS